MYAFTLEQPKTLADAKRFSGAGAQPLAGGQTLIASMKQRLLRPEQLVDLGGVAELRGVKVEGQTLVIGAMTCHQDVADNADVRKHIPGLAALAEGIGDRQVRARGTMGGSVANNDPAACYPAAVLGLGATIHTDKRTIPADSFFKGLYETALAEGEIITAVSFPIPEKAAWQKFKQPASRFSLVGVFVSKGPQGVRVAVTGAGACVFRATGLEAKLAGGWNAAALNGATVSADGLNSDLHGSAEYRAALIPVLAARAVASAA